MRGESPGQEPQGDAVAAGTHEDEPDSVTAVATWAPARGWIGRNTAQTQGTALPPMASSLPGPLPSGPQGDCSKRGNPALPGGSPSRRQGPPGRRGDTWAWAPSLRVLPQRANPGVSGWKLPSLTAVLGALHCDFGQRVSALTLNQLAEGTFSQQ